jgi:hypothetical protein
VVAFAVITALLALLVPALRRTSPAPASPVAARLDIEVPPTRTPAAARPSQGRNPALFSTGARWNMTSPISR